jgi:hypothetical protein
MDRAPQAASCPQPKTTVDALPGTEKHRQIPPSRSCPEHPQAAFDPQPQIRAAAPATLRPDQAVPTGLIFLIPPQRSSPRTNLGCSFTTGSIPSQELKASSVSVFPLLSCLSLFPNSS